MDSQAYPSRETSGPFPRGLIEGLQADVVGDLVAAGGDVAMVIDRNGFIRDMALSNDEMIRDGADRWLDQRWTDTVTTESRHKVDELLRDALLEGRTRWREINHIAPNQDSLAVRYLAVNAGRDGQVIAIGRDDRATAGLQRRLLEAQQAMERDYSRLRDAEFRYRLLFDMSAEAVIVVDAGSRRVVEANPAAERFVGRPGVSLVGETFARLFDAASQDGAAELLATVRSNGRAEGARARLVSHDRLFTVSASLFRQERATHCLVRLTPAELTEPVTSDAGPNLRAILERMPDAFVVTDESLRILSANSAFLDLARIGARNLAEGQLLGRFLGRAGVDRNIVVDTLRAHGVVRNFSTILRTLYDEPEDVEISAVAVPEGDQTCYGFTIRAVGRRFNGAPVNQAAPEFRRSVEQLTELVGRVTLKELVREATDLVERLCIEAALTLTADNRASAAEVLGLSRQSLYSKMHRFGLGNLGPTEH